MDMSTTTKQTYNQESDKKSYLINLTHCQTILNPGLYEPLELSKVKVRLFLYEFSSILFHSLQLISTHFNFAPLLKAFVAFHEWSVVELETDRSCAVVDVLNMFSCCCCF